MTDPAQDVFQMVYASSATVPFSKDDLRELLEHSRRNNERVGISGLLLYHDGDFMQLLEGGEQAVRTTYERILQDSRHRGCLLLITRHVAERTFPDWSMGFRDFASGEVQATPGYSGFLNQKTGKEGLPSQPSQALALLQSFRAHLR